VGQLVPLASGRSAGTTVRFAGKDHVVREAKPEEFDGCDFVFFAATGELSKTLAPEAARRGAVVIDKSNTWRMDPRVPLVVPEVNAAAADDHVGIISCPNCTTIGFVMALEPIRRAGGVKHATVTTLQAVSGAGKEGVEELDAQAAAVAKGAKPENKIFPRQIHGNVLPLCEKFRDDGYSTEEMKLLDETRKILSDPKLTVSMTCVRVPVPVGHSCTALVTTERPLSAEAAQKAIASFPGVKLIDEPKKNAFPIPSDVAGQDDVLVGRVRKDLGSDALWFWAVVDNVRKGAATNAVQIAESLIARNRVKPSGKVPF
jgi:aspartate-semialdehyde dehydrogenase